MRIIFTIITRSYFWSARALVSGLRENSKDSRIIVFVVDLDPGQDCEEIEGAEIQSANILLPMPEYRRYAFVYNAFEFCCFLRPFAHQHLFEELGADRILFIDADIYIFDDPWAPYEQFSETSIVLCTHINSASPDDISAYVELPLISQGQYNGGLLQLNRSRETMRFLSWWADRLKRFMKRTEHDQPWLGLARNFFDTAVVTNLGVNIGWWNMHERRIEKGCDGKYKVGSYALHSIHFSHWNVENPAVVSRWFPKILASPDWQEIAFQYAEKCKYCGYFKKSNYYLYDYFTDGVRIRSSMRHKFYENLVSGRDDGSDPFASSYQFYKMYIISKAKLFLYSVSRLIRISRKRSRI